MYEEPEEIKRLTDLHNKAYIDYRENNHLIEDENGNVKTRNVCFFCDTNFETEHKYSVIIRNNLMNTLLEWKSMYSNFDNTIVKLDLNNKFVYLIILYKNNNNNDNNDNNDNNIDKLALYLLHIESDKTVYVFEDKNDYEFVLNFLKN